MQVVSFGVASLYGGIWWMRWVRAGSEQMMWPKLGWFSAAICVGSALGAAAWAAQMLNFSLYYESNAPGPTRSQSHALLASALKFDAAFVVLYGFEFLCLIIAKLLLLGRLASNATRISSHEVSSGVRHMRMRAWSLPKVYHVMSGVVVAGSVVGAVASVVDGVYQVRSAGLTEQAAGACDAAGNDTNSSISFNAAAIISRSTARTANSVQSGSEAFTLLAVSLAFLLIVSWSIVLFRLAERAASLALDAIPDRNQMQRDASNTAKIVTDARQASVEQRRRLTSACVIVLITFPARAAFDLLQAYATFNDPINPACAQCDPCQTLPFLVSRWLVYTPEFQV
jgi:hypothetical protein